MKSIIIIAVIIIVLLILYRVDSVRNGISTFFLDKKYNTYTYLYENKTTSKNYEIVKILDAKSIKKPILFDKLNKNFIFTKDELYLSTIWKINSKGEKIDSLKIKGYLYPSGIYFFDDYYIDWAITGNKLKQKYDTIINYDELSKNEFKDYLNKATIVDYTRTSRKRIYIGRCHLKIQDKWIVIESEKLSKELENDYEKDYFELRHKNKDFLKKNGDRLIPLKNNILPFNDWKKQENMFFLQKFVKESYFRPQLFLGGDAGWRGTGYFKLTYKSDVFNFKSYTFKSNRFSYNPYISIYIPEKEYNLDIAFIRLNKESFSKHSSKNVGTFVLKRKL